MVAKLTHPFTRAYLCRWQIKLPGICIFSMCANYNNSTCIITSQYVREIHPQPKLQFCLIYKSGIRSSSTAVRGRAFWYLYLYLRMLQSIYNYTRSSWSFYFHMMLWNNFSVDEWVLPMKGYFIGFTQGQFINWGRLSLSFLQWHLPTWNIDQN